MFNFIFNVGVGINYRFVPLLMVEGYSVTWLEKDRLLHKGTPGSTPLVTGQLQTNVWTDGRVWTCACRYNQISSVFSWKSLPKNHKSHCCNCQHMSMISFFYFLENVQKAKHVVVFFNTFSEISKPPITQRGSQCCYRPSIALYYISLLIGFGNYQSLSNKKSNYKQQRSSSWATN